MIKLPANHVVLPWPRYAESKAKKGRLIEVVTRLTGKDQEERIQRNASRIIQPGLTKKNPSAWTGRNGI